MEPPRSEGPCRRCGESTFAWHQAEPYGDPQDVIHICPDCWKLLSERVKWVAEQFMDDRRRAEREGREQAKRDMEESASIRKAIAEEAQEISKIDPMVGVFDPSDPPEVQARDIARWEQTQAQMKLGEATD